MDKRKTLIGLLLALLMVLPIAAPFTSVAHADTYPEDVSGNVIKIGMTISLTGKFDEEGKQALCGIKAAIDWYNDQGGIEVGGQTYKLQLIYYDDTSSKDQVTSLYSRLIDQDQVDFLLAPYSSGLTAAAAGVATQRDTGPKPSFFCVGDVKQAIYGWRGGRSEIFDAFKDRYHPIARAGLERLLGR